MCSRMEITTLTTAIESVYSTLVKTASQALITRQRASETKCCFSNIYDHVLVHNSPLKWRSKVELCRFDSALAILWMSGMGQFTCGFLLKPVNVSDQSRTDLKSEGDENPTSKVMVTRVTCPVELKSFAVLEWLAVSEGGRCRWLHHLEMKEAPKQSYQCTDGTGCPVTLIWAV